MHIEIKNLYVSVKEKEILNNLNLNINEGEIHAIMGPNGTGKSTLSKVIMGYPDFNIKGKILANNTLINNLTIDERSRLGIFLVYQNPISISGLTSSELIKASVDTKGHKSLYEFALEIEKDMQELEMPKEMLHRSFNVGFSGGERKKNEILQVLMLKPKFIILDELDSGLDVDSLKVVCQNINNYLADNKDVSVLIITHYPKILEYIKPTYIHVMMDGKIKKTGDISLSKKIFETGYSIVSENDEDE